MVNRESKGKYAWLFASGSCANRGNLVWKASAALSRAWLSKKMPSGLWINIRTQDTDWACRKDSRHTYPGKGNSRLMWLESQLNGLRPRGPDTSTTLCGSIPLIETTWSRSVISGMTSVYTGISCMIRRISSCRFVSYLLSTDGCEKPQGTNNVVCWKKTTYM